MFGLSAREILFKAIINASINCKDVYKRAIVDNIETLSNTESEDDASALLLSIRGEYLDAVSNSVISSFQVSAPTVFSKIQFILMSPAMCGYDDINIDNGIMAGSLYAICYYALKSKVASPKDCIRLNHMQNDVMNQVLLEIDK